MTAWKDIPNLAGFIVTGFLALYFPITKFVHQWINRKDVNR